MIRAMLTNRTIQVVARMVQYPHNIYSLQGYRRVAPLLFLIYIHGIIAGIPPDVCMSLFAHDIAVFPTMPGMEGIVPLQRALCDETYPFFQFFRLL